MDAPRTELAWLLAIGSTFAAGLGVWRLRRRTGHLRLPRWPLTVAGFAMSLGLATLPLAAPHSWYARFLVVVFVLTAAAVFVMACAALTARGRRADGCRASFAMDTPSAARR
ncbi:MAG: hypothetical protein ABIQ73_11360 [Acidimicrobiales bacterium]